jgi:hypothetical protein
LYNLKYIFDVKLDEPPFTKDRGTERQRNGETKKQRDRGIERQRNRETEE